MFWYEIYYNEEYDTYALLVSYGDRLVVDFGCQMWLREYKRPSAAVKYLLSRGYEMSEAVVTLGNTRPPRIVNGKVFR